MALRELELQPAPRAPRRLALAGTRPRILLCTEGTYPYVMGGVSSWCDLLVNGLDEFDWLVLPIVAPGKREPLYALPPQAREVGRIEVWSEELPRGGGLRRAKPARPSCRPSLARHLIGWEGDPAALLDAFIACRRHPADVRRAFRSRRGWSAYLSALADVLAERIPEAGTPPRARPRRGRGALPDALLGGAHRRGADPRVRRAARDRRGLVGRSRRRPQGAARHADGAHRARRLPARGLPRERPQRRLPGHPLRQHAPGARPRALGLCRRRRDLPRHRRQRLLGDGARHRRRQDPGALQRPRPAGRADARRPAPARSSRSGASTRSRTSIRCCASPPAR